MYKAIFIDIDGTLIKADHSMSEVTIKTVKELIARNILVVLVSARPLHGIFSISSQVGLQDAPIVSLNGSYITKGTEVLFESSIDIQTTEKLNTLLSGYPNTIIYYQGMQWFTDDQNADTVHEQKITEVPLIIQPFSKTLKSWENENKGPDKILVIADPPTVKQIQDRSRNLYSGQLNIYPSKPTYLEFMNLAASKTNAIKFIINDYQINPEEIIAIGDNFNDEEMISFAGTGIAMGNAPDEVKAVADYVTDTNENDGVAKALAKYLGL